MNHKTTESPYYNLKLGPVNLTFDASVALEYNDNISLSEKNREGDVILTPRIGMNAYWPLSELNSLNFNLGIGYSKYLFTDQGDSVTALITPGSALSFDMFVGDFRFNFHDRFSYTQDPIEQVTLNNTVNYGLFTNEAGVAVDWDLNDVVLSAGYDHVNLIHPQSRFAYLDHTEHRFFGRSTFEIDPALSAGLEGSAAFSVYDSNRLQNDGLIYNFGPFVRYRMSEFLSVQLGAGYTGGYFDRGAGSRDLNDPSGYYANMQIQHIVNERLSHNLYFGRQTQFGLNTNYVESTFVRHTASWKIFPKTSFNTNLFGEFADESRSALGSENAFRWGGGFGIGHQITTHLNASISYNYVQKDSDILFQDYFQNRVLLELGYRF